MILNAVVTVLLQYLGIMAGLIALYLVLRDANKLPALLQGLSSLNTNAILAFKA